jgi:PAS domain S-box-containing protein
MARIDNAGPIFVGLWAVLAAALLALDLFLAPAFDAGALYVGLVLLAAWPPLERRVIPLAVAASALAAVGGDYALVGSAYWEAMISRSGDILIIWGATLVIFQSTRTANALREREERFRAVVDNLVDGIVTIDRHGIVETINSGAQRLFGYRTDEVVGQNVRMLMPEPYRSEHDEYIRNYLSTGQAKIIGIGREVTGQRKDGSTFPMALAVSAMTVRGQHYFTGIVRDLTARERAARELREHATLLEAANAELDAFAYSVSHDLRAPLRAINGFSQALMEDYHDKLADEAKDYLRRIGAASRRMGQLIDALLRLSRSTRGEMRREQVNLSVFAQTIATELRTKNPDRDVSFEIEPDVMVCAEPQLLRAALENLLENAWKFTSKHSRARIAFGVSRHHEETVYFVRDDGAGFDPAYAAKLFGSFQRLHAETDFEGTGIGLATVARIVRRHGGRIWAEGAVEQGATFYFTLAN